MREKARERKLTQGVREWLPSLHDLRSWLLAKRQRCRNGDDDVDGGEEEEAVISFMSEQGRKKCMR